MTIHAYSRIAETEQYYSPPHGHLNMSGNLPPRVPDVMDLEYRQSVQAVLGDRPPSDYVGAHQFRGSERDRSAGASFIGRRMSEIPVPDRVVVSNGTQSVMTMLLAGLVGQGGALAIEELSYPTIRQFAAMQGIRIVGVAIDEDGLLPDAFEQLCRRQPPKALYVQPTLHNPTTAIMPLTRRRALAETCQKYGVAIIEDDVYSLLPGDTPPPLAALAPELSWYLLGTAKSMAAALKVSYLLAPSPEAARKHFWPGGRATYWMCAPICAAIVSEMIENGGAERIIEAVREETRIRQQIVAEQLPLTHHRARPTSLQVWLSLPDTLSRDEFLLRARAKGISISTADAFYFGDGKAPNAIRFGTGTAPSRSEFERGLRAIVEAYDAP